jgi:hypothetical protein
MIMPRMANAAVPSPSASAGMESYAGGVILALDVATRTGVAWGGEKPHLETVSFAKKLQLPEVTDLWGDVDRDIFARALIWTATTIDVAEAQRRAVQLVVLESRRPPKPNGM